MKEEYTTYKDSNVPLWILHAVAAWVLSFLFARRFCFLMIFLIPLKNIQYFSPLDFFEQTAYNDSVRVEMPTL